MYHKTGTPPLTSWLDPATEPALRAVAVRRMTDDRFEQFTGFRDFARNDKVGVHVILRTSTPRHPAR